MGKIFLTNIISSKNLNTINYFQNHYIAINDSGVIEEISKENLQKKYNNYIFEDLSELYCLPGMIDLHNHLPQYAFSGIGGLELLPWLEKYTFPREALFLDKRLAKEASANFFNELIANGTTTTCSYVTVHKEATDIAFQAAHAIGLRAILGKVMMNRNAPEALLETTQESLQSTEELIKKWHRKTDKLFYAVTPRFAITCSEDLLSGAGDLAKKYDTYIQTHLSENKNEVNFTLELFPKAKNYTDIYKKAGLLGPKSIMAHSIHLEHNELDIIKETKSVIAHCPCSNRFLQSGIMPCSHYLNQDIKFGLGSDVAGGYSLSMFNEIKEMIEQSKMLKHFKPENNYKLITIEQAFYSATLGAASALGLEQTIGSVETDKAADIIFIDPKQADPSGDSNYQEPEHILSRLIYRGQKESVMRTYIQGDLLYKQ